MEQKDVANAMKALVEEASKRMMAAGLRLAAFVCQANPPAREKAEIELGEIACQLKEVEKDVDNAVILALGLFAEDHLPESQLLLLSERKKMVYGKQADATEIDGEGVARALAESDRIEDLYKVLKISITEKSLAVLANGPVFIQKFKKVVGKKKASIGFAEMTKEEKSKNGIVE